LLHVPIQSGGLTEPAVYPSHEPMNTDTSASGLLPHLGLLRFSGADAATFLQGQLSNDTRRLSGGSPLLAAYSSAQGRVVAVLHLLPHSSGLIAVLPRDLVQAAGERLRKFVLRAKVRIEDISDSLAVFGIQSGTEYLRGAGLPIPDAAGYAESNGVGVGRLPHNSHRYWVVGESAAVSAGMPLPHHTSVEKSWRLADIRAGLPQVYAATSELFVAQMLNLDLIDGISFTKGCYTGQEIIARTQHLGRIKRRMFRLRLPRGDWAIGQTLTLADGRSGRLTELAASGDEIEALAVLTLDAAAHDADAALSAKVEASELPLPYAALGATNGGRN
jgi:tRNA-modifying protein YgfZ